MEFHTNDSKKIHEVRKERLLMSYVIRELIQGSI